MLSNDKMLENINTKIESLASSVKNQLSFNKMIETQLAQIAAAIPVDNDGRIPGQPEIPLESLKMISIKHVNSCNHASFVDSPFVEKKVDPGRPIINCSIGPYFFNHAYCDLGAGVNVISKKLYEEIHG